MPRTQAQAELFTQQSPPRLKDHARRNKLEHGGGIRKGKRKLARPIDSKRAMHLVLKSERAKGHWSMLRPQYTRNIRRIADKAAQKNGVRIYKFANSGNH